MEMFRKSLLLFLAWLSCSHSPLSTQAPIHTRENLMIDTSSDDSSFEIEGSGETHYNGDEYDTSVNKLKSVPIWNGDFDDFDDINNDQEETSTTRTMTVETTPDDMIFSTDESMSTTQTSPTSGSPSSSTPIVPPDCALNQSFTPLRNAPCNQHFDPSTTEICCKYDEGGVGPGSVKRLDVTYSRNPPIVIESKSKFGCFSDDDYIGNDEMEARISGGLFCKIHPMLKNKCQSVSVVSRDQMCRLDRMVPPHTPHLSGACYLEMDMRLNNSFQLYSNIDYKFPVNFYPDIETNPDHYILARFAVGTFPVGNRTRGKLVKIKFVIEKRVRKYLTLMRICLT